MSFEGARKISTECSRKVSVECGRKASLESGRKVSVEGGRKMSFECGRKVSVESGMESSPVVLKRAGTRTSREEGTGAVKVSHCEHSSTCLCTHVCVREGETSLFFTSGYSV